MFYYEYKIFQSLNSNTEPNSYLQSKIQTSTEYLSKMGITHVLMSTHPVTALL